jgi:hypothetical protein
MSGLSSEMNHPSSAEHMVGIVLSVLGTIAVIIFAVWSRSVLASLFAVFVIVLLLMSLLRSRWLSEE